MSTFALGSSTTISDELIEILPAAVYVCNAEGLITRYNRRAAELWGREARVFDPSMRFCGSLRAFRMDGTPVTLADAPMGEVLGTGIPVRDGEVIIERPDGSRLTLLVNISPLRDEQGRLVGAVNVFQDITDRRRMELEIARLYQAEHEARAAAEHANRAKMDFLAMMSHELRTPLNAIGGYVELLSLGLRGPLTLEQQDDLERIGKNHKHLLGLINEVLNFARLESGNMRYDLEDFELGPVLLDVEALVLPQLSAKAIGYQSDAVEHCVVHADRERVRQILLNLLSNAVKFTPSGGHVSLRCSATKHTVLIEVIDDGPGIPRDKLEVIFEPFLQLSPALTRTEQGVGLGLAISRDLARGMGGDLSAISELSKGSTFTVELPMSRPAETPAR